MVIAIVLCLLCITSVLSDSSMSMNTIKEMSSDKMPMMDTAISKEKRYLSHHHDGLPCPPFYPHLSHHPPPVTIVKPVQTKTIVSPISYHMPTYAHQPVQKWQPVHQPVWQPMHQPWRPMFQPWQPAHQPWQPMHQQIWQPKVVVQKPVFSYAPMYHHQPSHPVQPHWSQNAVKIQQPVYHKPLVLLKPCTPMPCKPTMPPYQYHKSEIKYVQPQPQVSYIKVSQPQPIIHPMPVYLPPSPPVHVHKFSHGIKEICTK